MTIAFETEDAAPSAATRVAGAGPFLAGAGTLALASVGILTVTAGAEMPATLLAAGALALAGIGLARPAFARAPSWATVMKPARRPELPETLPAAVVDRAGRVLAANRAFATLLRLCELPPTTSPLALATDAESARACFVLARRLTERDRLPAQIVLRRPRPLTWNEVPCDHLLIEARAVPGIAEGALVTIEPLARAGSGPERPGLPLFADTLVGALPVPSAVLAPDGSLPAVNALFLEALGLDTGAADAASGAGALDRLVRKDDVPSVSAVLAAGEDGSRRTAIDVVAVRGPRRVLRLSGRALPGWPSPAPVLVTVEDVTEQNAIEVQLAQSQKLQAVGQLAGGIAHDFNNVLTAIIGFSDLLLQSHRPTDPSFRDIMNIKQSANRAAGLVRQLLAFSSRQTLRPRRLQLNDALAEIAAMLDRLLGETISLDISYGRDLAPVMVDFNQLEQVVINLAVNARDAMRGGGRLTIETRNLSGHALAAFGEEARALGSAVLIAITDTGCGIPQDILDKIFEPFFTTKPLGEGTGLGLATVYGIVKQSGGLLKVDSRVGEGTRFSILLPQAPEAAEPACPPRSAAATADARTAAARPAEQSDLTGSGSILLVEDEEAIRAFAARALANKGYRVATAGTGGEALALLSQPDTAVDLLVTDVVMPEMAGPALAREARRARPGLKVIFISGYADGQLAGAADDLADCRFLAKPFALKALVEAVKDELAT